LVIKEENEDKISNNEQTDDTNNALLADHPDESVPVDNNDNQVEQTDKDKENSIIEIRKKRFSQFPSSLTELKSLYYDPTCLMRSIDIDDFIEMFIRVTKSKIWRSDEERDFLALQNRSVPLSEGGDVKVVETDNTVSEFNENSDPNANSGNVQTINSFQYQPLNNPEYINWINKFLNNDDFMRLFN
jgi:hypothetical protein